jgi:hypothetical protein
MAHACVPEGPTVSAYAQVIIFMLILFITQAYTEARIFALARRITAADLRRGRWALCRRTSFRCRVPRQQLRAGVPLLV